MQSFRQIYTQYVKNHLAKEDEEDNINNNRHNEQLKPRIILIATFCETIYSIKHNLSTLGVDVQRHIDDGSLVIVDAFSSYYPDVEGMKKLIVSLSELAKKESRVGVTAIVDMGFFLPIWWRRQSYRIDKL